MRPSASDYSQKLCVHGLGVEFTSAVPALQACIDHFLYPLSVEQFPDGLHAVSGSIRPYEESEVVKCLSSGAKRLKHPTDPFLELYQDGERFWVVDEDWGIAEINCLRRSWRSWVLPRTDLDVVRIFDAAVMWPMAQLLRPRGLHLVPAVSMVKEGWGVLMLTQHLPVEGEITRLIRSGYQVIGQRWTALRDEDGKIELLHLPGAVERPTLPRTRDGMPAPGPAKSQWIDLTLEHPGSMHNYAFCDMVLMIDPRRAMVAERHELGTPQAVETLRHEWPITDIYPPKKWADLVTRVAQLARCVRVQLSYDPADLSLMLQALRATPRKADRFNVTLFQRDQWGRPMAGSSNAA